ncbi:CsbD family protein [Undibacterium sp. Ji67W]|uniref:CsbD family protein n=1 Tax=Undibacterium sp. Ji67W TaxID=3413042 RepID=UPI003BF390FA
MNKDQINGRTEEVKGKIKEVAGKIVGKKDIQIKGNIQKNAGAVQAAVGDTKADIAKAINNS